MQTGPVETQHSLQAGGPISGCKRQESDRRDDDRCSGSQHLKHVKLNCGAAASDSIRSAKTNRQTDYSVSMQVLPRKQSIGLYSGETKALFCISLFGQKRSTPKKIEERSEQGWVVQKRTIVLKIKSTCAIRKVLHPKSARKGGRNATVLIDDFAFNGESRDVLVQVADLSHDISLQVSARVIQAPGWPAIAIIPSKVTRSIERPATSTVAEDNTYVLAQLLRYAASRVLDHELSTPRSQAVCSVEKSRVKEVLGMIRQSPAVVKSLPMVQDLRQKLESLEYDSWCLV